MVKLSEEKFKEAYRQEKDPKAIKSLLAVNVALYKKESTQHDRRTSILQDSAGTRGRAKQ